MKLKNGKTEFWQWDRGQVLIIDEFPAGTSVHFSNKNSEIAVVSKTNNNFEAVVPDILLQSPESIYVYIYIENDSGTDYTKRSYCYVVHPRPRPADYVYTPEEIRIWETKLNRNLGAENAGKLLSVGDDGNVTTVKDSSGQEPPEALDNTELEELLRNFT